RSYLMVCRIWRGASQSSAITGIPHDSARIKNFLAQYTVFLYSTVSDPVSPASITSCFYLSPKEFHGRQEKRSSLRKEQSAGRGPGTDCKAVWQGFCHAHGRRRCSRGSTGRLIRFA